MTTSNRIVLRAIQVATLSAATALALLPSGAEETLPTGAEAEAAQRAYETGAKTAAELRSYNTGPVDIDTAEAARSELAESGYRLLLPGDQRAPAVIARDGGYGSQGFHHGLPETRARTAVREEKYPGVRTTESPYGS